MLGSAEALLASVEENRRDLTEACKILIGSVSVDYSEFLSFPEWGELRRFYLHLLI